jgi:hypothetical protein
VLTNFISLRSLPSRSAPPMSSRKPSQRASPWDGTAAYSASHGGEIKRYPSQYRDHRTRTHSHPRFRPGTSTSDSSPYNTSDEQSDSSSSEGGSGWKDKPVVPVIVPSLQWMLRNGHLKPEDVVPKHALGRNGGNGWLGGLARSMSLNSHGGSPYASSPYGSPAPSNVSLPAGYYGATPYSSPYMPAGSVGSVYASPYISQAQSLPPMQSMPVSYGYTAWAPPERQGSPTPGAYGAAAANGGAGVPRVPSWHAGVSYGSPYMGQPQMQY